ncbi:hypothetical protein AB9K24_05585 [Meridianimaribacter flavus]
MAKRNNNSIIVLFVEGDSEKEFYQELISFYRGEISGDVPKIKIYNLKGIGRFENKVASKIKLEILPNYLEDNIYVFCCYDSDVFELGKKPPTNWSIVEKKLKELGVNNFYRIIAKRMIEDWFLTDLNGLLTFLKLKKSPKLKGRNAYEKMKVLFKAGNKIYQKGNSSHKFISSLNIQIIRDNYSKELENLEDTLGYKKK